MKWILGGILFSIFATAKPSPVELAIQSKNQYCKEYNFVNNLTLYRDPSSWDLSDTGKSFQNTRLTTIIGRYNILKISDGFYVKSFLHPNELLKIIPIKICAPGAYSETTAYVFADDLEEATIDRNKPVDTPPSTRGNPIPVPKDIKP